MGEIPEDGELPDLPAPPNFDGNAPEMGEIPEDGGQQVISAPVQRQQTENNDRNRTERNQSGITGSRAANRSDEGIASETRGATPSSFGNQAGSQFGRRNSRTESTDAFFEGIVQTDLNLKLDIF